MKDKTKSNPMVIYSLKILLGIIAVALVVTVLSFLFSFKNWQQLAKEAMSGQNHIKAGISLMTNRDFKGANAQFSQAETKFINSNLEISQLRRTWLPAKLAFGRNQLNHLSSLSDSALIISRSASRVNNLAINLSANSFANNENYSSLSLEQKAAFLQSLIALEPELNGLRANIDISLIKLRSIPKISLLWPIYSELEAAKEELSVVSVLLNKAMPIVRLIPAFSGYPETAHYLIMLQNNDELRPSGGFLGSYVRLDISNFGEIDKLEASDIYHLDMPSIGKTQFTAPLPITTYLKVNNWYLRDANWSPDWPSSAKQINTMFQAESSAVGNEEPEMDAIIAITPEFVANLLRITGPITVRGESYASENMQALLQYNVEVAYKEDDISSWDRKDIINDLISELKNRLTTLPLKQYPLLLEKVDDSILRKDLLIYFNNKNDQLIAQELKVSGELSKAHQDYLMVVDANLAAFKSDAVMAKNIFYKLENGKDGLSAQTKLSYTHNGGFDWRTTRYRSFTRVYAPLGSKLIKIDGLKNNETDITIYDDKELNKTVFGFFWSIEPGSHREVSVNYTLANSVLNDLKQDKEYNLLVQRQPGSRIEGLSISVDLNEGIIGIKPNDAQSEKRQTGAYWTANLNVDQEFKIITK